MELPNGVEFEVEGTIPDGIGMDPIVTEYGDGYRVAWTVHDDDAWGGWEWDDASADPAGWGNGVFRDFRNSRDGGGEIARDEFMAEMIEAVGEDNVFVVEVYSHGNESFSRVETKWYPDREWDVCPACVLAVPADVTDPKAYADSVLNAFTKWANGDVWGVVVNYVKVDGTVTSEDSCWGYIGGEYAEEVARSGI